jgi:uncharacterized membrane protein
MVKIVMKPRIVFFILLALVAAFVWFTSSALPPMVAAHFAASGQANGFMPRATYLALLLFLIVVAPLLLAFVPLVVIRKNGSNLNIPNRDYWLDAMRREGTVAYLHAHGLWFAVIVALFLTYVHWLVLQANQLQPPVLSTTALVTGLVVFFLATAAWLLVLYVHFRKRA